MKMFRVLIGAGAVGTTLAVGCVLAMQSGVSSPIVEPAAAQPIAEPTIAKTILDRAPIGRDEGPAEAPRTVAVQAAPPPVVVAQAAPAPEYTQSIKPRPSAEAAPRPAPVRTAAAAPARSLRCLTVEEMQKSDGDGDFTRNLAVLERSSKDLCLSLDRFEEGGLQWTLQIIRNTQKKSDGRTPPLWFVPHDDENAAFDTAIDSVVKYGGTVVAVESGGERLMQGQDPNRNFDAGGDRKCPQQLARSPQYTKHVMDYWDQEAKQPIIALHSNRPTGNITITRKVPFSTNFPGQEKLIGGKTPKNPDHTLVFVASRDAPDADPHLKKFVNGLNHDGVNVIYETVASKHSDCSLSNYASLMDIREYLNVEVVTGDSAIQKEIVAVLMRRLDAPIGPRVASAKPASAPAPEGAADSDSKPKKKKKDAKKAPAEGAAARSRPPNDQ